MTKRSRANKTIFSILEEAAPADKRIKLTDEQIIGIKKISSIVLAVVAVSGTMALSAIAPNIFLALDKLLKKENKRKKFTTKEKKMKVSQAFYYLKRTGQIKFKPTVNDITMKLTSKGKKKVKKIGIDSLSIDKPDYWDGKWWLVAADIPTRSHRMGADLFREKLRGLGFHSLQRTLWMYPYDPRDEIEFVASYYGIERFVTVMEINRMDVEDEKLLRELFGL